MNKLSSLLTNLQKLETCQNQDFKESDIPQVAQSNVRSCLKSLRTNKATVHDDIPAKIVKYLANELTQPLTLIINTAIRKGQWPDIWKTAIITPIPKNIQQKKLENYVE